VNSFHNFDIYWKIYYYNNDSYARFQQGNYSDIYRIFSKGACLLEKKVGRVWMITREEKKVTSTIYRQGGKYGVFA
jgi:hypothetical protein